MKIGIMTLFHDNYNYGAVLQAYALQKAIEKLGHNAEILDYDRTAEPIDPVDNSIFSKIRKKLGSIEAYGDVYNLTHLFASKSHYVIGITERKKRFQQFYQNHLKVSKYYNLGTVSASNNDFDAFVCGSDQVWRPGSFDPNYYLAYAAQGKRKISYAASLGVRELIKAAQQTMLPLIEGLDAISVREQEAAEILKKFGINAQVTLDPTLLWDRSFWEDIAADGGLEKREYILCYFIGENNANREIARKVSKKKGLPLVAIPGVSRILPYDFQYADINKTEAGPDEFLGLIRDAAVVVTDSFHACVFSTVFNTPFVAVERFAQNDSNSMNGRIYDYLSMFGLGNQLVRKGDVIATEILKEIRPRTADYEKLKDSSWIYLRDKLPSEWVNQPVHVEIPIGVYAAQTTNIEKRKNSSSGGIFYCLAKKVLSNGGVVVACKLDEQGRSIHDVCKNLEGLTPFMTSKYVQSDMGSSISIVGKELQQGNEVLFVGTPCQAAGLLSYLKAKKIDTARLLCVDFICHGVPSPYVWQEYLHGVVGGERAKFITANFRHKFYGWRKFAISVETANFKRYLGDKDSDLYLRGFLNNIFLRPSCYSCRFKTLKHHADLTLGDFWHFEQFKSSIMDDDTGVSLVITQSEKGDKQLHDLDDVSLDPMPMEVVSKSNKNMFLPARKGKLREGFFDEYETFKKNYSGEDAMQQYLKQLIGDKASHKAKKIVKKMVKKVLRR